MQDLDTMTNVILNNEYKLHEEEQKTNFESGNNGNNNQNNNSNKTKKRRKKKNLRSRNTICGRTLCI